MTSNHPPTEIEDKKQTSVSEDKKPQVEEKSSIPEKRKDDTQDDDDDDDDDNNQELQAAIYALRQAPISPPMDSGARSLSKSNQNGEV